MPTTVDGINTGLDTTAMIDAIVNVAAIPKLKMQQQLEALEDRREKVAGLKNRLEDLSSTVEKLDEPDEFRKLSSTLSDPDQLGVTLDAETALPGSWSLRVERLASAETEVSQGFADKSSAGVLREGTYTLTYGETSTEVTLDAGSTSLEDLASALNEIEGITAYVLDTGEETDPFRLVVQGQDTGADHAISLAGPAEGEGAALTMTEKVSALDAHLVINGIDVWSSTNKVEGAVPGMTFDLKETSTTAASLTVARDDSAISSAVQSFVDKYNAVVSYFRTNTVYNSDTGLKGPLVGDSSARRVMERLRTLVSAQYDTGDSLSALSQIGISTKQDGSLELDTDKLQDALDADFGAVAALFTSEDGPLATLKTTIDDVFVDSESGILVTRDESLQTSIETMQERIDAADARLESMAARLREQFNDLEVIVGTIQSTSQALYSMSS